MFNFHLSLFKKGAISLKKVQRMVAKIRNKVDGFSTRNKYVGLHKYDHLAGRELCRLEVTCNPEN